MLPRPTAWSRPALVALAALVGGTPAGAQVAERLADLRLATAVRLALVEDARTRPLDVEVLARGGAVRIEGAEGAVAAEIARRVPGVQSVNGPVRTDRPAPAPTTVERRPAPPATGGGAAEPPEEAVLHAVRPGDTLFSLARRYGTTVDAILDLNGLRSPTIAVGQRLRVR